MRIECLIIAHSHGDHDCGNGGGKIRSANEVSRVYDYARSRTGRSFNLEGAREFLAQLIKQGEEVSPVGHSPRNAN